MWRHFWVSLFFILIGQQAVTSLLVGVVIGLTAMLLLGANYVQDKVAGYGIPFISKLTGLILASYAVRSVLSGLKNYFVFLT